jgi:hypothetical protein
MSSTSSIIRLTLTKSTWIIQLLALLVGLHLLLQISNANVATAFVDGVRNNPNVASSHFAAVL